MVRFINDERTAPTPGSGTRLRVIAAGVPRSATSSTQAALERLGYAPCLHMAEILPHPERTQLLLDIVNETADTARRQKLLARLLDGYAAVSDLPVVFNIPDLMDMYPDVRVVLNQRPSGAIWAKSAYESLGFFFTRAFGVVGLLVRSDRLWYRLNMATERRARREYAIDSVFSATMHDRYIERVRAEAALRGVPLLEFRPEHGWAPLCAFLDADVPPEPFPRLNEAATFRTVKYIVIARGLFSWALLGAAAWAARRYGPLLWSLARGSQS